MKILQVVPYFSPAYSFGGTVKMAFQVSMELVKRNHQVVVWTSDAKDLDSRLTVEPVSIVDGIKVHYMRNLSMMPVKKSKLFITPELISRVKEEIKEFDIVHLHEYRSFQNIVVHHYAKKYGIPYVLQAHGSLPRIMSKKMLKWIYDVFFGCRLLKDAKNVIAVSQLEAEQFRGMGVPEEKIVIIPNGIDISEYANLPPKGCFKKKFGIKEEEKIVLYLGRIHKIKGIDILVKAFANIIRKLEYVRLVIVGPDDGYLDKIKFLIETKNVKNKVLITGPLYGKDKLETYVDADVFVMPSRYEIFGISILEACFCGKPVIASSVGGPKDLIIDGVTGLLFTPENIGQLVESLLFLLDDNAKAEKMGIKGKHFVKENFTIENVVDRLEILYEIFKGKQGR